jgi:CubicO group peptidase (beta-lactamase class C family)
MRGSLAALAGFLALSFATFTPAQRADAAAEAKAEALIASMGQADTFGGTVLVAKNGQAVLRKAIGMANREWNIPNVPEGKFRIGSITKGFTATAILQLQEAGKLSINDPIAKYYSAAPASWNAITIKHLLTHRSGIPSYTGLPNFINTTARQDLTPEQIIKLTQDKPLQFEPGSKYAYDNTGYVLLGYVIEKVSGQSYVDYMQEHIFKPLGMNSTGSALPATSERKTAF